MLYMCTVHLTFYFSLTSVTINYKLHLERNQNGLRNVDAMLKSEMMNETVHWPLFTDG